MEQADAAEQGRCRNLHPRNRDPIVLQTEADTGEGETEADRSVLSGTLEVWSSGEELGRFVEGFQAAYPDVTVNITVVPNEDFVAKLTPTLAGGQGAPDVFTGESDYVKYLVESGFWDDLEGAPYHADTSDMWEYVASFGRHAPGAELAGKSRFCDVPPRYGAGCAGHGRPGKGGRNDQQR